MNCYWKSPSGWSRRAACGPELSNSNDHRIVVMIPKLCLLLGCAALAYGAQPQKVFPYDYSQEDLPNGLRLITVPTDYANIVATYIVVQTGSRNEVEPGLTGFAHLFEHRSEERRVGECRSRWSPYH